MLQSAVREAIGLRIPLDRVLAGATGASFLWLLLSDRIPPLVIVLLELFLSF